MHYKLLTPFSLCLILLIIASTLIFTRKKTKSTYFLIGLLAGLILYTLAWLIGYLIDIPIIAYVKSLFITLSALSFVFLALFTTHYHKNTNASESRLFFRTTIGFCIFIFIPYFILFLKIPVIYSFSGNGGYILDIRKNPFFYYVINQGGHVCGLIFYIWAILILFKKAITIELIQIFSVSANKSNTSRPRKKGRSLGTLSFFRKWRLLFSLKERSAVACRSIGLCLISQLMWFFIYPLVEHQPLTNTGRILIFLFLYLLVISSFFLVSIYMNNRDEESSFSIKLFGFSVILPLFVINFICTLYLVQHKELYDYKNSQEIDMLMNSYLEGSRRSPPGDIDYILLREKEDQLIFLYSKENQLTPDLFLQEEQQGNRSYPRYVNNFQVSTIQVKENLPLFRSNLKSVFTGEKKLQRYLYYIISFDKKYYEFGYKYEQYRAYMHSGTSICILIILCSAFILHISLGIFIRFTIQKPLALLLHGVDDIKRGNLDTSIPILNNDEFGSISDSINGMVKSMKISQEQLSAHTENLEVLVEKRTKTIQENAEKEKQINLALQKEMTERKKIETELEYNALHDPLTNLPNRTLLIDHLLYTMNQQERKENPPLIGLMFIDLDRFKIINDSLGHEFGDKLLIEIGHRLTESLRKQDTIARIGGDEFIVLIPDITDIFNIRHCADRILKKVKLPFIYKNKKVIVTASIGITLSTTKYDKPEEMIRDADIAMYRAKAWGKDQYAFFDTKMHERVAREQEMESALHTATIKKDFFFVFQPIINLKTKKVISFEALIRWQDPILGNIPPCNFIPLAEETGLIIPIGDLVLEKSIEACQEWHNNGFSDVKISINCSAKQFLNAHFHTYISKVLKKAQFNPKNLIIEITETLFLNHDSEDVQVNLLSLKRMGIHLAMDDFGTGYSSLASLHNLPIDILKIDRSISLNIPGESAMNNIIHAIISLAHHLNLTVVVEGIESLEQVNFLSSFENIHIQGYFFSKPISKENALALLKET
ncbi:MAG: EAL domain-containing protein [Spirochaetales bacterium]|nr:EAL domain-containing protein [Spirochaetales bacterium]